MLFRGVGTAMVTPMTENGINYDKLRESVNRQIKNGADAIVLLGTTGEAPTITEEEKKRIIEEGVDEASGRVPVIAGCGTNDTATCIRLCEQAQKAGADGFLINNPYYNKSSDDGIYAHYKAVSDSVDKPIIVYNVPSRTGKNLSCELMLRLCEIKNVKAFKEAGGNISQITRLCAEKPEDVQVFSGNDDQTLAVLSVGGEGVISTASNILPQEYHDLVQAFFAGDIKKAREIQFGLLRLHEVLFCECNPIPVKTAMNLMGLDMGILRLPLVPLAGDKLEKLKTVLGEYGLLS